MQFEIQEAAQEEWGEIQRVAQVAFPSTYEQILSPEQLDYMMDWMYSEASLRRQITEEGHRYFVARTTEGTVVGYVSIQPEGEAVYHLQKIYVLPEWQGCGVGQRLFERALQEVRAALPQGGRMELNVNRSNRAKGFYERMGMRVVREGDFPIGGGFFMNDYIMGMEV